MEPPADRPTAILYHEYDPLRASSPRRARELAAEREVHQTALEVQAALESRGLRAEVVALGEDLPETAATLRALGPSLVFNLAEGFRWESRHEAHIAAWLEVEGHPYTGTDPLGLGLCRDKGMARKVLTARGVPVPWGQLFPPGEFEPRAELPFPLIVKPAEEDGSLGLDEGAVVMDREGLRSRVEALWSSYSGPALAEAFIEGREVNVGLLGWEGSPILPLGEVDYSSLPPPLPRVLTYGAKWEPEGESFRKTPIRCPASLPKGLEEEVREMARLAFEALGCRDYGRVDLRIDAQGRPFVIDVNPNPDLSREAGLACQAAAGGLSYEDLVLGIAQAAWERVHVS